MRHSLLHGKRGFTLVELIIVMLVLALMAAVTAPSLSGFVKGRKAEEETRRFVALTRYAREEAISRGLRLRLWVAADGTSYGLRAADATKDGNPDIVKFDCQDKLAVVAKETDVISDGGEAGIVFWPDGSVDRETAPELELLEDGKVIAEFTLQPKSDLFESVRPVDER